MHELAIAQSIIDSVLRKMQQDNYASVQEIGLRIGALTDIVPDALQFGFDVSVKGTPLESARLAIDLIPITGACGACGNEFTVEQLHFVCPRCNSPEIEMIHGDELDIAYIEVTDDPDSAVTRGADRD